MVDSRPVEDVASLVERLGGRLVGRRREIELVVAALAADRHVLIEGPPGTGKSTLLRAVADELGVGFEFVEGNAELTPARLVGHFDPARVLVDGYDPDVFVDGPLVTALRDGSLLYVEEINRVPEETLNVLITVMSERELHVPRLGRVVAAPGFRLVAAMNPFDAVGTARISGAVYDRVCRLASTTSRRRRRRRSSSVRCRRSTRPGRRSRRTRPAHPVASRPPRRLVGQGCDRHVCRRIVARRRAWAVGQLTDVSPRRRTRRPVRPGAAARGLRPHGRGDRHRAVGGGVRP